MPEPVISNIHEKVLASNLLLAGTAESSAALDKFASWLVAGFGAALGFLIANLGGISVFVSPATLKCTATLFLWSAAIVAVEKYLAAVIGGASRASSIAAAAGEKAAADQLEIDFAVVFAEMKKALIWPTRSLASRAFTKALAGDLAYSSRCLARLSHLQGVLVLAVSVLVVWAIARITNGLVT